jgi:hypothetical protein
LKRLDHVQLESPRLTLQVRIASEVGSEVILSQAP